jgi:gliding motility-associated-like protein
VSTSLAGPFSDAFVMTPIPGVYFSSPWPDAAWIAHNVDGSHAGNVDYYYRLNIDLPCFNECGFSYADSGVYCLTMDFFTDNSVNEIYVNGIPQSPNQPLLPVANQYFNTGYNAAGGLTIQLCNDWQPGSNELIVKVSSGGPFEGFLAQYSTSSLNQPNDPTISAPGNDTVFCSNDAASTLTAASTGGTWNASCGACINASGTFDPTIAGPGTHTVTYSTNSLCPATDTITIVVNAFVDASISAAGPYCQNNPADTLSSLNPGGTWLGTGITNASLGIFNPSTAGAGTFQIIYGFAGNCPDADTISVTVNPTPTANAGADQVLPCVPPTVNLNGSGSSAGTYVWTTPDGNIVSGAATNTVTVDATGTYTLTVTDANGCINSDAATVTATTPPVASFTANPTTGYFPLVVTTVNSSTGNNLSYLWESDNGESFTSNEPTFTYTNDSTYTLTLYVTDINGCIDSSSVTIVVWEEFEILVPNVFSPTGDGVNDVFEVVVKGVQNIDVQIYNRWGNFIYGYNQLDGFWDGKNDGKDCPEGTYFYIITLTKDNGETAGYQGHVTLVR